MLQVTTRRLYVWVVIIFAVNSAILATTRATLDYSRLPEYALWCGQFALLFWAFARLALRYRDNRVLARLAGLFEGLFFLQLAWLNLRLLNHLTMMLPVPFKDDLLSSWDQALGVNWVGYFEFVHQHPALIRVLDQSYTSLTPLSVFALSGLILMGQMNRARYFTEIFFATAVLCILPGALMPAVAAVAYHIPEISAYPNFPHPPGVYHLSYLDALRNAAEPVVLAPDRLPGLVTFPSFHTAAGVLLCVAYFRTKLFLPVLGYALVMIASPPVFGGHYFVDLLAGTGVALVLSWVLSGRRGARLADPRETADEPIPARAYSKRRPA